MRTFIFLTSFAFATLFPNPLFAANNTTPPKVTVVALGDSITEGYGIEKAFAYPTLLEKSLQESGYSIRILNAGISGSTSASGPGRLKWFLKSKPDYVFIALGANDGLRAVPASETKKNLEAVISECKKNNIRVLLASMKMPPNFGAKYTKEYEEIFPLVAKKYNVPLYPFLLEGVAGHPNLNQPDGIHPTEAGQKIIAEKLQAFFLQNITELKNQRAKK